MTPYDLANGAAVVCAIVASACVPARSRPMTLALAAVFAVNWLDYVLSYSARPPVAILWDYGIYLRSNDVWAMLDASVAVVALLCWVNARAWWGAAIYSLALAQVILHGLYWDIQTLPRDIYYPALDKLFLAQVAVFILAGGGGLVDRIGRVLDCVRDACCAPRAA